MLRYGISTKTTISAATSSGPFQEELLADAGWYQAQVIMEQTYDLTDRRSFAADHLSKSGVLRVLINYQQTGRRRPQSVRKVCRTRLESAATALARGDRRGRSILNAAGL